MKSITNCYALAEFWGFADVGIAHSAAAELIGLQGGVHLICLFASLVLINISRNESGAPLGNIQTTHHDIALQGDKLLANRGTCIYRMVQGIKDFRAISQYVYSE